MSGEFELSGAFETEVLQASETTPVLVDFWAEWCAPCRMLGPTLEKLAHAAAGRWRLVKVDTEAHPELSMRYGIRSIPAVKLFAGGGPVAEFVGALPETEIVRWLDAHLPPPAELAAAREDAVALLGAHPDQAMELARTLPEDDAARDAILTLGRLIGIAQGREPSTIGGDPANRESYLSAARSFAAGRPRDALAEWIRLVEADRTLDDDGARRACVAVFQLLGEEAELTREMRRPFSMALN